MSAIQQVLLAYGGGAGGSGPLFDLFSPGNGNGYSVRKLRGAQTNCLRVRRSSDNTEQDIGFSGDALDTTSLLSFVGGGNGFVTTWYDQSGNGVNVTQATTTLQPRIVNAGSVDTENGLPALFFDGTDDALYSTFASAALNTRINSLACVVRCTRTSSGMEAVISTKISGIGADYQTGLILERRTTNVSANRTRGNATNNYIGQQGSDSNITAMTNIVYMVNGVGSTEGMWIDNVSKSLSAAYSAGTTTIADYMSAGSGSRRIVIGNGNSGFNDTTFGRPFAGRIAEVVLWDSDLNASRATIYSNQKTYFGTP